MPFLTKAWKWISGNQIAQIAIGLVFALIGWEVVKRNIQETGRIKERERQAAANAREQAHVTQVLAQQQTENQNAVARANAAAANLPSSISAAELRSRDPRLADLVFGPDQSGHR